MFIAGDIECTNTAFNWTCPGGYIQVGSATWLTVAECMQTSEEIGHQVLTAQMQNKCDNKTSCEFNVTDSNFGVSCEGICSGLSYSYECVRKSLMLCIYISLLLFSPQFNMET